MRLVNKICAKIVRQANGVVIFPNFMDCNKNVMWWLIRDVVAQIEMWWLITQ